MTAETSVWSVGRCGVDGGICKSGVPTWTDKIGSYLCMDGIYLKQMGVMRDPWERDGVGRQKVLGVALGE